MSNLNECLYAGGGYEIRESGAWDLTLPDGRHQRGTAASIEEAEREALAEYDSWIMARVRRGHPVAGQQFIFSLKGRGR